MIKVLIATMLICSSESSNDARLIFWCGPELNAIALNMEVLEQKEVISFFTPVWAERYCINDLRIIRNRLVEARDYPYLDSLNVYSDISIEELYIMMDINNTKILHIESHIWLYRQDKQAILERDWLIQYGRVLKSLTIAKKPTNSILNRRQNLNTLRELVGKDNFEKGLFH